MTRSLEISQMRRSFITRVSQQRGCSCQPRINTPPRRFNHSTANHSKNYVFLVSSSSGNPTATSNTLKPLNDRAPKLWKSSGGGVGVKPEDYAKRTFYGTENLVLVGLPESKKKSSTANTARDEAATNEQVRLASWHGVQHLLSSTSLSRAWDGSETETEVFVQPGDGSKSHAHAAATGAHLALYKWNMKTDENAKRELKFRREGLVLKELEVEKQVKNEQRKALSWETGKIYAEGQMLCRDLQDLPGNVLTPTSFSERTVEIFKDIPNVEVRIRDEDWIRSRSMGAFLSVAKGSDEPPKFVEIHYRGRTKDKAPSPDDDSPKEVDVSFVGKGITFDSGGISLKPGAKMKEMRSDMGGAAAVISSAWSAARLELPLNLSVFIPMCENMPSGGANKPGDIVVAANGKTIEVDNTDAEGRLALADALVYASSVYQAPCILDVATLTGAMRIALGELYTGVFSSDDALWGELEASGYDEFDRFWRMPLADEYLKMIDGTGADLCNVGGSLAGSCTAAIFLREFVDGFAQEESKGDETNASPVQWAHLDIAGTMMNSTSQGYNTAGMAGRPVRSLIEFLRRRAQNV